jgi:hypothetical protein
LVAVSLLPAEAVKQYLLLNFSAVELDEMAKDRHTIDVASKKCVPDDDTSSPMMQYVTTHVVPTPSICYVQLLVRDNLYKRKNRAQRAAATTSVTSA